MKIEMFGLKGIPCPAGAEKVAENLATRLVKRGHEVTVYVRPHYTPHEMQQYEGVKLIHLPSIATKNLDAISHSFLATLSVLQRRPQIVHIHSIGSSIFSPIVRMAGLKVLVQSHGLDWQRAKWGRFARSYLKFSDYSAVNFPDATTVVSQKLKKYYETRYQKKVHYIPNGVNLANPLPPDEIRKFGLKGNDYILFAARLVPEKGCHYLIEAFKKLGKCSKKLVIAGDAVLNDTYGERLKQCACQDIIFTGFAGGTLFQELLSNAYVFVLPSEIEGLSTGLLEAMGYGNCVLVSDIEENLEAICECGFTFRSKDTDALCEKLVFLLQNEFLVKEYGHKAQARIAQHNSWDDIVNQYERLYEHILNCHGETSA